MSMEFIVPSLRIAMITELSDSGAIEEMIGTIFTA
jgi:hypothetical protein